MQRHARPVKNSLEGVNLAAHILNAVDIPAGVVRPADNSFNDNDYTMWIVIKDLKNKVLYFRTYENLALRAIDLNKLDMSPGTPKKAISIQGGSEVVDVSANLK